VNASSDSVRIAPAPTIGVSEFENFVNDSVTDNLVTDFRDQINVGGIDEKVDGIGRDLKPIMIDDLELCATKRSVDRMTDFVTAIIDRRRNMLFLFLRQPLESVF